MAERRRADLRAVGAIVLAILAIYLLLVVPNHSDTLTLPGFLRFPLDLPALLVLLLLFPRATRGAVAFFLAAIAVVSLADLAASLAYQRPFNPVLDLGLVRAAWEMLRDTLGLAAACGAAMAVLGAIVAVVAAAGWATGRVAGLHPQPGGRRVLAVLALPALAAAIAGARLAEPAGLAVSSTRLAFDHLRGSWRAHVDLAGFREAAAQDPFSAVPTDELLAGLRGHDVLVIFVESYGRAALENRRYAPTITATLAASGARLGERGLAMRSGWLTAPMIGGQSWLAHASVLSGLWIADQGRYRALLASPRRTLLHLAHAAGWRTVAVMPAISRSWPEGKWFGYDRVLAAGDLGYRGRPFNWVTMPDQFALAGFERAELAAPHTPVFAEIALISSHAPWTPVPPLLPWDALADGTVFDPYATAGDPPEVVWRDEDRIREQYGKALDYTLRTVAEFAERRAGTEPLIVVLGDHQPAAFVSEDRTGRDVPVHLIGPPELIAAVESWGWTRGLVPGADVPAWRMDAFRDRFLTAFSTPPVPVSAAAAPRH